MPPLVLPRSVSSQSLSNLNIHLNGSLLLCGLVTRTLSFPFRVSDDGSWAEVNTVDSSPARVLSGGDGHHLHNLNKTFLKRVLQDKIETMRQHDDTQGNENEVRKQIHVE